MANDPSMGRRRSWALPSCAPPSAAVAEAYTRGRGVTMAVRPAIRARGAAAARERRRGCGCRSRRSVRRSRRVLPDRAPALRRDLDEQLGGELLLHGLDVADHADGSSTLAQLVERAHRDVERLGIERAEPLVDEQRVERDTAGAARDDLGQSEGQGERCQERLAARERLRGPGASGVTGPSPRARARSRRRVRRAHRSAAGCSARPTSRRAGRWRPRRSPPARPRARTSRASSGGCSGRARRPCGRGARSPRPRRRGRRWRRRRTRLAPRHRRAPRRAARPARGRRPRNARAPRPGRAPRPPPPYRWAPPGSISSSSSMSADFSAASRAS